MSRLRPPTLVPPRKPSATLRQATPGLRPPGAPSASPPKAGAPPAPQAEPASPLAAPRVPVIEELEAEPDEEIDAEPDDEGDARATPAPDQAGATLPDDADDGRRSARPGAYRMASARSKNSRHPVATITGEAGRTGTEPPPASVIDDSVERELTARQKRLEASDTVGAARTCLELGLLAEWSTRDREVARKHYEAARSRARTLQPPLTRLRRLGAAPAGSPSVFEILEDELALAETDALRADLLATRARLHESAGQLEQARRSYEDALRFAPRHAASLHGLEVALRRSIQQDGADLAKELAAHLGREAESVTPDGTEGDASLAAWLHVERADVQERLLGDHASARQTLQTAVALAPGPGPVRMSLVRHLCRHDRDAGLLEALRVEADREADLERSARLLYASARIALDRVGARGDGIALLGKAEQRAPAGSHTQLRVLDELTRELEADQEHTRLVELRQKRLGLLTGKEVTAFEYVRLAESYGRLGRADLAVEASARALSQDPASQAAREALDAALQRLGRHPERVRHWLVEANAERPAPRRVAAFLRAADIASRHLAQPAQAIDALRAAWLLVPGDGRLFDALSALLRVPAPTDEAAVRGAETRLDLYEQAAATETDPERRIALLEKGLAILEDELARPDRAIAFAERILEIDKNRRSAVLAIERNARRAGDGARLAKALLDEAGATTDAELRARLLLQAAEVTERLGDRDRALVLVDKAREAKPADRDAERFRADLLKRMGRADEARRTLVSLVSHDPGSAWELWLEIADLDEVSRKAPLEAVDAYRKAHDLRPEHPLPLVASVRLLRTTKAWPRLVAELGRLARAAAEPRDAARLLFAAAEVEELCLGDDAAALKTLDAADELFVSAAAFDPAVFEAMERILFRLGDEPGLVRLYARWLERKPPAAVDHGLRIALAASLEITAPQQAVDVLEALVGVVPQHVPALRRLEHLHRTRQSHQALATTLLAQSAVVTSRVARAGALWEAAAQEERVGTSTTLDALTRIVREEPHDTAALDQLVRVASRLVANVGVPHPALAAARQHLCAAIRARRDLTVDPLARAAYLLEEAMLLERDELERDPRGALVAYREALTLWPDSLLAARGLERTADEMGDAKSGIEAQLGLAKLVDAPRARAKHLVRAAELTVSHLGDDRQALELFEVALEADPENREAARSLASMLVQDPRRLVERLRPALDRAESPEQVVGLGGEIGGAYLRIAQTQPEGRLDFGPAVAAMRRVLGVAPEDVPSLLLMARLLSGQKAWAEAKATLIRVVELTGSEPKTRVLALFSLADIHEGPLGDPAAAQHDLVGVLKVEPTHKQALERLHRIAVAAGDRALARSTLERLAEYESDPAARTEYQLRLADVCREGSDAAGMIKAIADAIVTAPHDARPWAHLARTYRSDTPEGAASLVHALEQVVELAKSRRRGLEPRWLMTLGLLEINVLKRHSEGIAHLTTAAGMPSTTPQGTPSPPHPELRAALGTGLLGAGRTREAVITLRELLTQDADTLLRLAEPSAFAQLKNACVAPTGTVLSAALACLDAALATEGRSEERMAVEEVRAVLGELPTERLAALRTRRLEAESPHANALAGTELARTLVPEARSPMVDVAIAIAPVAAKALRFELATLGVGSRERIGPRDGHPTRQLADRIARSLGIGDFELYLTPSWSGAARVYPGDPPAIVGPLALAQYPEAEQAFALGRLLARVALGAAWLDEVPVEVADGLLLSALRTAAPQFGMGEISAAREQSVTAVLPSMQRAIGRRQRKLLEDLLHQGQVSAAFDPRVLSIGIRRSEYRAAYVLSGDLLSGVDYLKRVDAEIGRAADNPRILLQHPVTNELLRWALSGDAYNERRRAGTVFPAYR